MTKKEFLEAVNEIDDEFINELVDVPREISENRGADYYSEEPEVVILTNEHIPFWKIAFSAAAAVCVLTLGIFAAARLYNSIAVSPNDSTSASSADAASIASEASLPTSEPIPKIDRVDDEGHEFEFKLGGTMLKQFSTTVVKNDDEDCAVFHISCRNVSEENPLRIWIFLVENGETVERVNHITITENDSNYYTVPYDYYSLKNGEECLLGMVADDEVYVEGKWLP